MLTRLPATPRPPPPYPPPPYPTPIPPRRRLPRALLQVLSHAKTNMADLIAKDVRFKAACRTAAEDVLLVAPAYEPEKKNDIMAVLKSSTKAAIKASKIKQTPILDPAVMTPPQKRRMVIRHL